MAIPDIPPAYYTVDEPNAFALLFLDPREAVRHARRCDRAFPIRLLLVDPAIAPTAWDLPVLHRWTMSEADAEEFAPTTTNAQATKAIREHAAADAEALARALEETVIAECMRTMRENFGPDVPAAPRLVIHVEGREE